MCWQLQFSGFYGLFGRVLLKMVHPCLTHNSCHGVDVVHAQGKNEPPVRDSYSLNFSLSSLTHGSS